MHREPVLWQHHQSHILAMNSTHTLDVVNEAVHSVKVSEISCLEVTHRINFWKLCHGIIHFSQSLGFLRIHDCTEVHNVDKCKFNDFICSLFPEITLAIAYAALINNTNRSVDACQIIKKCIHCILRRWLQ